MRWLKRIVVGVVVLLALLVLVGLGYESLGRDRAATAYPPPGRMVDVGGRRLHFDCRGSGSPTVVFEAGLDTFGSLSWSKVQDSIAAFTRACSYDRAGVMWSDPADGPHDAEQVARDLWAGLDAIGETGPFVLVGHSLGGPYLLVETHDRPDAVVGLVFVDASHPDQLERFKPVVDTKAKQDQLLRFAPIAARLGVVRLLARRAPAQNPTVPARALQLDAAFSGRSMSSMVAEARSIAATLKEAGGDRDLGDRWLIVLTARKPPSDAELAQMGMTREQSDGMRAVWDSLHQEEAGFSSRSRRVRVDDASHYIQFDRPDVVIGAVRSVVDSVRLDTTTAAR
jgi:pimeloyl-ACP methyl ester carboxylesterase